MSYLCYYGGGASASSAPRLEMSVTGTGPTVTVAAPTVPPGVPGTVVTSTDTTVEVSCQGGTCCDQQSRMRHARAHFHLAGVALA